MARDMTRTSRREVALGQDGGGGRPRAVFQPRADIYETDDKVVVIAEMPSVGPDDVDVTLERRVLTIRGRGSSFEHPSYGPILSEYTEGDYERVFAISEDIDRDRIKATQKDGVLILELPKAEPAKARKITVQSS